jgi:hypothetical protein
MGRKKLTKEVMEQICDHVRETGLVTGADAKYMLPVSMNYVQLVLKPSSKDFKPEFREMYEAALHDYRVLNWKPADDVDFKQNLQTLLKLVSSGEQWEQFYEYDNEGKVSKRWGIKYTLPSWLWEVAFPKVVFSQESILSVLPQLIEDIIIERPFSDEFQADLFRFLHNWKERQIERLKSQGKRTDKLQDKE